MARLYSIALLSLALVIASLACRSAPVVRCDYAAKEDASPATLQFSEFGPRGVCAKRLPDGSLSIESVHVAALSFVSGLASLLTEDGWYYLRPDGGNAPVATHDNGPDYFSEGLARTRRSSGVGFIDRELSEVVAPTWDHAFPFEGGRALVCQGCRSRRTSDGEHLEVIGGTWGYIDRTGKIVVPVTLDREAALRKSR